MKKKAVGDELMFPVFVLLERDSEAPFVIRLRPDPADAVAVACPIFASKQYCEFFGSGAPIPLDMLEYDTAEDLLEYAEAIREQTDAECVLLGTEPDPDTGLEFQAVRGLDDFIDELQERQTESSQTYDLFFAFCSIPDEDQIAWSDLKTMAEGKLSQAEIEDPPENILRFYAGFYLGFPELFPKRKKSGGRKTQPSSVFLGQLSKSVSTIRVPMEYADRVLSTAVMLGHSFQVPVFDPSTGYIHRTDGFDGMEMTVEGSQNFLSPNLRQIFEAVDSMSPQGGPGFVVLDHSDGDYAQAAGGDGKYTCEWRKTRGKAFRHWVAGHLGEVQGKVQIPTNGFQVTVNSNECLTNDDVKSIFEDFANEKPLPRQWIWRETTDQFQ